MMLSNYSQRQVHTCLLSAYHVYDDFKETMVEGVVGGGFVKLAVQLIQGTKIDLGTIASYNLLQLFYCTYHSHCEKPHDLLINVTIILM